MDIKARIKDLLKKKNWSLCKLAKESGISQNAVYNWFNEKNYMPTIDALSDVCLALDISLAEFFADIDSDNLTENEFRLLELFRKVPDKKKDTVLDVIQTFTDN